MGTTVRCIRLKILFIAATVPLLVACTSGPGGPVALLSPCGSAQGAPVPNLMAPTQALADLHAPSQASVCTPFSIYADYVTSGCEYPPEALSFKVDDQAKTVAFTLHAYIVGGPTSTPCAVGNATVAHRVARTLTLSQPGLYRLFAQGTHGEISANVEVAASPHVTPNWTPPPLAVAQAVASDRPDCTAYTPNPNATAKAPDFGLNVQPGAVTLIFDLSVVVRQTPAQKTITSKDCRLDSAVNDLLAKYNVIYIKDESLGFPNAQTAEMESSFFVGFPPSTDTVAIVKLLLGLPGVKTAYRSPLSAAG
jgi:hypothetical protein